MYSEDQNREREVQERREDRRIANERFREFCSDEIPAGFKLVDCKYTPEKVLIPINQNQK